MILKLNENKTGYVNKFKDLLNKSQPSPELNKEKGENILFVGCIGSGKTETQFSLYQLLFSEGYIDERSIYLSVYGDSSVYLKWVSILDKYSKNKINKNDFILFNLLDEKEREVFNLINFKSKGIQKIINKHTMFLFPALEKSASELSLECSKQFTDFLNNLPVNNGKEIPIFISDLYILKKKDYIHYAKIVKDLNNKGYFFVATIEGYPTGEAEDSVVILKEVFKHIFIMKTHTEDEILINIFDKIKLKRNIKDLNAGEYYYLNNFIPTHKEPRNFPYITTSILNTLPNYERLDKFLLIHKIEGF